MRFESVTPFDHHTYHVTYDMFCRSRDWCGPVVSALVKSRYIAFSEGWALYAENPLIANETGKT